MRSKIDLTHSNSEAVHANFFFGCMPISFCFLSADSLDISVYTHSVFYIMYGIVIRIDILYTYTHHNNDL